MSSSASVSRLAQKIAKDHKPLDVLINDASIACGHGITTGAEHRGFELRIVVNNLSYFLLTFRLLPLLRKSAPARIINFSSVGQQAIGLEDIMMQHDYDSLRADRRSKLAQIMVILDLAKDLKVSDVT
jgi:NAD(P)-dependent dehydrogenase (short-subunit alcohol dehydrogenase family)